MSPDPLTLNQRAALEAHMTKQATEHLAEIARQNSKAWREIDRLERNLQALKIGTIVCLIFALVALVLFVRERAKVHFGPFKVGYSDKGPPEGWWDYCQGIEQITGPTVCIWGPAPSTGILRPSPTPSSGYSYSPPVATSVRFIIAPTERRLVPQPTTPKALPTRPAPVNPGTVSVEDILAAGGLCGVPGSVAVRIAARESGMRQFDKRGRLLRSRSGALGVLQVKPIAAREVSKTLRIERTWDNLIAGFCYLSSRKGDWPQKIRSYRAGSRGKATPEVEAYVATIMEGFEQ